MTQFKDSVLYIDTQSTETTLENQVLHHLEWIRRNPEKAQAMAKKAHDIVTRQWTVASPLGLDNRTHANIVQTKTQAQKGTMLCV